MNNPTKNIELLELQCENIGAITSFDGEFNGHNVAIRGQTGTGKSTIADGWCWLINNKDSLGRANSQLRPLYRDGPKKNEPIRGLVMAVEATLLIEQDSNACSWVLRKEEHEEIKEEKFDGATKQKYSYPKKHFINGDFVKEKDFNAWLAAIADPDVLRMLTDLKYFLADEKKGGMHYTKRRKLLRAMGGNIGTPQGFPDVDEAIKGRTLIGYKKELADQKAEYEKEQEAINPQIGENQRYANYEQTGSEEELTAKREKVSLAIAEIVVERKEVVAGEKQRQGKIDDLNKLTCQRLQRETELKNDTSGTKSLTDEKVFIEAVYAEQEQALTKLQGEVGTKRAALEGAENGLRESLLALQNVRTEYDKAKAEQKTDTDYLALVHTKDCNAASDELRTAALAHVNAYDEGRQDRLYDIKERGNSIKGGVVDRKVTIADLRVQLHLLLTACEKAKSELRDKEAANKARITEIDELIKGNPKTKPANDGQWQDFTAEIEKLQAEIGEPVSEQLERIDARKSAAETTRDKYSDALRNADKAKEANARIAELEAINRDLAQKIVTISGKLHRIKLYQKAESELIAAAVNGRFKCITFKLFNELLNGELDDCCEAMLNGVPYAKLSGGEKILADTDANRAAGIYYNLRLPFFIDDRPLLTKPLEAPRSQMIELYGVEGVDELRVEVAERMAAA